MGILFLHINQNIMIGLARFKQTDDLLNGINLIGMTVFKSSGLLEIVLCKIKVAELQHIQNWTSGAQLQLVGRFMLFYTLLNIKFVSHLISA